MRFPTLRQRLYALIDDCDVALALPGGVGTLAEIAVMWSQLQTGASDPKPLILIGKGWEAVIESFYMKFGDYVAAKDRVWIQFATDVDEAFKLIRAMTPKR
jgi:predicted Rossmann-fold nucleotide-binding protein